jgi:putative membrane protein
MYIKRNIKLDLILRFAWKNLVFFTLWAGLVFYGYYGLQWTFLNIAFEPLSVIGIAVAFYVGFKNSQSYDRFWEARKIWGGIVNYSRTWALQVLSLVPDDKGTHRQMIYRQLAWINVLRIQLRRPNSFAMRENNAVESLFDRHGERNPDYQDVFPFLEEDEIEQLKARRNIAAHLVKDQGLQVKALLETGRISEFDKRILMETLEELYNLQGKCERIKNTPFPRQFAHYSTIFSWIFVLLLPLGLIDVFKRDLTEVASDFQNFYVFLMIPFSVLISWIFITMEQVGSNNEDPFEGRLNDVPMTAICRSIEIDLRDMLDETELPPPVTPKDNILY